MNFNLWS